MACQEHEDTVVPVGHITVQLVAGCRLIFIRLQERCGLPTAEESRIKHQPDDKLHTCFEVVISFRSTPGC